MPAAGFRLEKIRVGGIKNLGVADAADSLWRLAAETLAQFARFGEWKPAAVFSMGGYVAGPPVLAALVRGVPVVVMEPNAVPGFTNRRIARWVRRALISFEETARFFPPGRTELTGLPVREEFFAIPKKPPGREFTVLITGGSQGSRTLNEAARESWPLFREAGLPVRFIHQTGPRCMNDLAKEFAATGLSGRSRRRLLRTCPPRLRRPTWSCAGRAQARFRNWRRRASHRCWFRFLSRPISTRLKNAEAFERAGAAMRCRSTATGTGRSLFEVVRDFIRQNAADLRAMGEARDGWRIRAPRAGPRKY